MRDVIGGLPAAPLVDAPCFPSEFLGCDCVALADRTVEGVVAEVVCLPARVSSARAECTMMAGFEKCVEFWEASSKDEVDSADLWCRGAKGDVEEGIRDSAESRLLYEKRVVLLG